MPLTLTLAMRSVFLLESVRLLRRERWSMRWKRLPNSPDYLTQPFVQLTTVPVTVRRPLLVIMPRPLWAVISMVSRARSTMPSSLPR